MNTQDQEHINKTPSREREVSAVSGWPMLVINIALIASGVFFFIRSIYEVEGLHQSFPALKFIAGVLCLILGVVSLIGHFTLQPNQSRVQILFGAYHGTVKKSGFHWANPFYSKRTKVSLRSHNFSTEKVKVNTGTLYS